MEQLTQTGEVIKSISPNNMKLDKQIKRVLSCKPILSVILADVVDECKGMSCREIESCIEGDISIEKVRLFPSEKEIITGSSQEDFQPGENTVVYDIRTYLCLPGYDKPELAKILINVEAQKDDTPGYSIPTRGMFYTGRMLSAQLGTEFTVHSDDKKKYANLKKVYSIWICTNTADKRKNSIKKYSMVEDTIFGENCDNDRYDLQTVVVINIGQKNECTETGNKTIDVLNVLFNNSIGVTQKLDLLKNKYDIPVTKEIEKEVETMCTYTTSIQEESKAEGKIEGKVEGKNELAKLIQLLIQNGRNDDIEKAVTSDEYCKKLYKEFGIS
jgi:hypothetical protein